MNDEIEVGIKLIYIPTASQETNIFKLAKIIRQQATDNILGGVIDN